MGLIATADFNSVIDEVCRYYGCLLGTSASGLGMGVPNGGYGSEEAAQNLDDLLLAMTDTEPIAALVSQVRTLRTISDSAVTAANFVSPLLVALQAHIMAQQITNVVTLENYLAHLNVTQATKWQGLQSYRWKRLYEVFTGGTTPAPYNLYFEVLQGATYDKGLGRFVVSGAGAGTYTDGVAVDAAYAGGFPKVNVSGLAGSGLVTVTGTAYDPATQATSGSKTWTATVSGNGLTALAPGGATPAPTDSLIVGVDNITIAAGITAGTIYVEAHRPTGRPLLP